MGTDRWLEDSWRRDWGEPREEGKYIWVTNGRTDDRVALWERHPKHPYTGGEILIAGPSLVPVQVWTTELVLEKLRLGDLIRVPSMREEELAQQGPPVVDAGASINSGWERYEETEPEALQSLDSCPVCGHALLYHSYPDGRWCMECPENMRGDCIALRGSLDPVPEPDVGDDADHHPATAPKPDAPWAGRKSRRIN